MLLRHDDRWSKPLQALGSRVYLLDSKSNGRANREADLRQDRGPGLRRRSRHRVGDADPRSPSFASILSVETLSADRLRSGRHPRGFRGRDIAEAAKHAARRMRRRAARLIERSDGWSATALRHWWHAPPATGVAGACGWRLERSLAIYGRPPAAGIPTVSWIPGSLRQLSERASLALLTNKTAGGGRMRFSTASISRLLQLRDRRRGDGPFPRKPDPLGCASGSRSPAREPESDFWSATSAIDWANGPFGLTAIASRGTASGLKVFRRWILRAWTERSHDRRSGELCRCSNLLRCADRSCRASMHCEVVPYKLMISWWHRHC